MPRISVRRRTLRLVHCAASAGLLSLGAHAAESAARAPCVLEGAGGSDKPMVIALDATHPAGFANWNVRRWQRHRLWITLAATNAGDAPATVLPQLLVDARPDGGAGWLLAGRPVVVPPHAAADERLSVWVPDDAKTLGVRLGEGGGSAVSVAFSHACSDVRFDVGTLAVPAAALLQEALAIYLDGSADPIPNPREAADTALRQATGAQDRVDVAWALRGMMQSLRDDHGFVAGPGEPLPAPPAQAAHEPSFEWLPEDIAVVRLHGGDTASVEQALALAQALHDGLASRASRHPRGWIVDLRGNGGADPWPSMAGLSALLGGPVVGATAGRREREDWIVDRGAVRVGGTTLLDLQSPPEAPFAGPVAVLVDRMTADEGEVVAVAFQGRPHTRIFGTATAGCPSWCTRTHVLSDGTTLGVLEARPADRGGRVQREPVMPDEPLDARALIESVPREAVAWVLEERRQTP